eukprot:2941339-Prymnesium_polylepis.2
MALHERAADVRWLGWVLGLGWVTVFVDSVPMSREGRERVISHPRVPPLKLPRPGRAVTYIHVALQIRGSRPSYT